MLTCGCFDMIKVLKNYSAKSERRVFSERIFGTNVRKGIDKRTDVLYNPKYKQMFDAAGGGGERTDTGKRKDQAEVRP